MSVVMITLSSNHTIFLPMQGEGVGDPAGGGKESTVAGHVIQETAGCRAARI